DSDAGIGAGLQARRRLQARHLRSVARLFPEGRRRDEVRQARAGRHDDPGPADVLRAGLVAGEPPTPRPLSPDRPPPPPPPLAHPQGLTGAEARRLAREGRAFVHIDGGLHSTEVAGWSHTPQLLYDLVNRASDPDIKPILDNVVLMLWPTINPDGQQMVAEWYMHNVGTPYELSGMPRLYQEYVGHDNNRDAYMLNMIESRVLEHTWRQWEPQIIYVHHQSGPFPTRIWLPPFSEPVGSDAP